jgi:two-component system, OmpR family, sensor histidine kinase CiaH
MWAYESKKNNMSKMPADNRVQLRRATIVYWILLTYILAALIWWFVSLESQNREVTDLKYKNLSEQTGLSAEEKFDALKKIDSENKRNTAKYIGEGVAFLLLITVGAVFIYRSVRKQFIMQQQQQNFMMAVTHELKTPISVARLNLETIQKYQLDPEKQKKLIRMTLDETTRLNSLTNNILVSSQLEGGGYQSSMEELDLSDLLKDRMQDFRNRFPERSFTEEITPDIDLKGDALLLQMLINNLVENAIKYAPKETPIMARLFKQGSNLHLIINDLGSGVPDSEKKKVFNKFYRVGNESTRKTQGTGLGLYLCQSIAGYHNADISVTDNKPCGSKFVVIFHT